MIARVAEAAAEAPVDEVTDEAPEAVEDGQ